MVYPWTVASKIREFPYVHYYKHKVFFKNYVYSLMIVAPFVFYAFMRSRKMRKESHHQINYFDPHQIPAKKLASYH